MNEANRPTVLLGATTWWPLAARLAMAFLRHGCRVAAVCPPGHPLRLVAGVEALYTYRGFDSIGSLRSAIVASHPDLIVPCDDGVVWQLHQIYAGTPELRPLLEQSLGPAHAYPIIRGRNALLETAIKLRLRVPATQTLEAEAAVAEWSHGFPAVMKLDGTWGGSGVAIVSTKEDAIAAYRKLARPMGFGMVWKRWLVNCDPLAFWTWGGQKQTSVSLQAYIPGRPANAMIACWKGEVLGIVTVEVLTAQGATGAATVVRLIRNEEIEHAARALAGALELTGFHGLDFMIEASTGVPYLIELNPRCTQLGHLPLAGQGDLAAMICAKLGSVIQADESAVECRIGDTVAFFPQAILWNPKSPYLRTGYHDVPWEEPLLFRDLLRSSWPERQWLNRLYHWIRPAKRSGEAKF